MLGILLGGLRFRFLFWSLFRQCFFSGEAKGTDAQNERLTQNSNSPQNRRLEKLPLLTQPEEPVFHDSNGSILTAHCDGIALRRPHHDTFDDGLAAHQDFIVT